MTPLVLDFESYYAKDFTLKDLTPVEYVLDSRFEAIGCAVKDSANQPAYWVDGPDLQAFFNAAPRDVMLVSHNMLFDGAIAAWRYNYYPKRYGCTLSMARALLGSTLNRFGLDRVAVHLGVGCKLPGVLASAKGRSYSEIKSDLSYYRDYVAYGLNDCELCAAVLNALTPKFPPEEFEVVDMVMRCALQPKFVLDQGLLEQHLHEVIQSKERLMQAAGISDRSPLLSNQKFSDLLRSYGVEPPTKISPITGKTTLALAKNDEGLQDLLGHSDPAVQAIVAARLGVKSTIEETRAKRFLAISKLTWPITVSSYSMPMPLRYGAAHTHRFGGDWDVNVQNLGRGGNLRKALQAPPGFKVVRADASQIEARLTAWLAGETLMLEAFAAGRDVYSEFGSELFGTPVSRETPVERHLAKAGVLGCGFYLGWKKFMRTTNSARLPDGNGGVIQIDSGRAMQIVNGYRSIYWHVPQLWRMLNDVAIPCLAGTSGWTRMTVGPIVVEKGVATLPSLDGELGRGLPLAYRDLQLDPITREWTFAWGDHRKKLYSGKLLENFVQALDRVLVIGAALRLQRLLHPYGLAQQAHDENCYVVPERFSGAVGQLLQVEMERRPAWGPDLPLAAEVKIADSYG